MCNPKRDDENVFSKVLGEIDRVTKLLQRQDATLSDCRMYIDSLLHGVAVYLTDADSVLYVCRLGNKYVSINANIATNPQFESGVVKIKRGEAPSMTDG